MLFTLEILSVITIITYYSICIYISVNNNELSDKIRRFAVRRTIKSVISDIKTSTNKKLYAIKNFFSDKDWTVISNVTGMNSSHLERPISDEFKDTIRQIVIEVIDERANEESNTISRQSIQESYF